MVVSNVSVCCIIFALFLLTVSRAGGNSEENPATENVRKLSMAINDFGIRLYHKFASEGSMNIFFSPLSISMALGMLLYGSRGQTSEEISKTLGFQNIGLPQDVVHDTFRHLLTGMLKQNSSSKSLLKIANTILISEDFPVFPKYKEYISNTYRAPVRHLNFHSYPDQIKDEVNNWVKDQTNGKIKDFLATLDVNTVILILNAVYFKGMWAIPFNPKETMLRTFYNEGQKTKAKEVYSMVRSSNYYYASIPGFQALELPYTGGNISMLILLPNQPNQLSEVEAQLTHQRLQAIRSQMVKRDVILSLPKFKVEDSRGLVKDLDALGIRQAFQDGYADLSGIGEKNLSVSGVLHKAFIEVDEKGTTATSATALQLVLLSAASTVFEFLAEHPFIFLILDKSSDMILFLGRLNSL